VFIYCKRQQHHWDCIPQNLSESSWYCLHCWLVVTTHQEFWVWGQLLHWKSWQHFPLVVETITFWGVFRGFKTGGMVERLRIQARHHWKTNWKIFRFWKVHSAILWVSEFISTICLHVPSLLRWVACLSVTYFLIMLIPLFMNNHKSKKPEFLILSSCSATASSLNFLFLAFGFE